MDTDLETTIRESIAASVRVPVDEVVPTASITDDLGADSLLQMTIVMDLERRFGISIPDAEAARFVTVNHAIAAVRSRVTK